MPATFGEATFGEATFVDATSAIVLGAGIGGLCAAARLADAGWSVTVVERLRHLGGRFGTRQIDGFNLPTGAFMIATDDPLAWTFADLGIPFPVREARVRPAYLIEGEMIEIGERGGLRTLVAAAAAHDGSDIEAVMAAMRGAISESITATDEPLPDWLLAHGAGPTVTDVLNANTRAYLALNAHEVSARAFFSYLRTTAGGARYGIPPGGAQEVVGALAAFVEDHGGRVMLDSAVAEITTVTDVSGPVNGVVLRDGRRLATDLVVSGLGLRGTAALLPAALADRLPPAPVERDAPGVATFIASREPFFDHLAVTVAGSRCVCIVTTPTLLAPELAPEGWHFTESLSTFRSSTDQSDPKAEIARHMEDLDELFPDWRSRGRLLQTSTYRGSWPVARTWHGHEPAARFPVAGLALVGDAVKATGWTGVGASAESSRIVVGEVLDGAGR